jgi:hypothetical protein
LRRAEWLAARWLAHARKGRAFFFAFFWGGPGEKNFCFFKSINYFFSKNKNIAAGGKKNKRKKDAFFRETFSIIFPNRWCRLELGCMT